MSNRQRSGVFFFALVILLIPLFFLNIRNTHDWGDDFAQYILQAINLAEGKPQDAGSYIYNPDYSIYAPPLYPVGFPILLAPVYLMFGNDILAFNYFQTFVLVLFGISIFFFLKRFMDFLPSLLLTLVAVYNPWMLEFKTEIISELSFSLFFLWTVRCYLSFREKPTWIKGVLAGCLAGFAMLIKPAGFVLIVAVGMDLLVRLIKRRDDSKTYLNKYIAALLFPALIYFLVNLILIPSSVETAGHFHELYDTYEKLNQRLNTNTTYYIDRFQDLFKYTNPDWDLFVGVTKAFALVLFLLGFFGKIFNRLGFPETVMIIFLMSVLLFPNTTQGFRYLIPALPFLLLYIYHGFESIQLGTMNRKAVFAIACLFCLFQYKTSIENIRKYQPNMMAGPQETLSREAFAAIKDLTSPDDIVAFVKPRALALYAGRKSLTNRLDQEYDGIKSFFIKNRVRYILLSRDLPNPALDAYLDKEAGLTELAWENEKFTLYRKLN